MVRLLVMASYVRRLETSAISQKAGAIARGGGGAGAGQRLVAVQIHFGREPNTDAFALESSFTLSSTAPAINPVTQPVTLQAGTFTTTIPPSSFKQIGDLFTFAGVINGMNLQALITPTGTLRYAFVAAAERASLTGTVNPVPVTLTIGSDTGMTSTKALIFH